MQRKGPGDYLLAAPTFKLLEKAAVPLLDRAFGAMLGMGKLKGGAYGQFEISEQGEKLLWGAKQERRTQIAFGHAENPDSLEAAEYRAAWLDEAAQKQFKQGSWEAVQRRLAIDQGRCLFTTTPYVFNWFKTDVYDRADRNRRGVGLAGDKGFEVVSFESRLNPAFPPEEWDRAMSTLPKWKFDMFYRGRFTRPAGAIYDCFDADYHALPSFIPPPTWKIHCGIDFGAPNFAAVFLAEEPGTGKLCAYKEYRPQEAKTAAKHIEAMKAIAGRVPEVIVGGAKSEGQWRSEFAANGWPIREPDQPLVEVGIDRVYAAFRDDKLFITQGCPKLLDEIQSYSRPVDDEGNVEEGIEDKDTYHSCFVAGTLVATSEGQRPIESVRPGDMVLTRQGFRRVLVSGLPTVRKLIKMSFEGGELIGSVDHPIYTTTGIVRLDTIRYNDTIVFNDPSLECQCQKLKRNSEERQLYSSAKITIATPTRREESLGAISMEVRGGFIETFISTSKVKYQRGATSTTSTETLSTTQSKTWKRCCQRRTPISTQLLQSNVLFSQPNSRVYGTSRLNGMLLLRALRGIAKTAKGRGLTGRGSKKYASTARGNSSAWLGETTSSIAPANADPMQGIFEATTISPSAVPGALKSSPKTNTPEPCIAPKVVPQKQNHLRPWRPGVRKVLSVTDAGAGVVYNLSVEGVHEYFANGVLVSNCDSLRYIVGWLRRPSTGFEFKVY
jgi:hypothetical protein